MLFADVPFVAQIVFAVVLGLALGSFTTCVVYRVPRGLSVWRNKNGEGAYRSFCPHCKTPLTAWDLIPVFSWLFLRGRCRYCGHAIGVSYVLIEAVTTGLVCGIVLAWGLTPLTLFLCALIPMCAGVWSFFVLKPRL